MVVAGNDPGELVSQHFFEHLGVSAGRDEKEDGPEGDKCPEVASFSYVFPAAFDDNEGCGGGDIPFDHSNHRDAGLEDPRGDITDGACLDTDIEDGIHDFGNPSAGDAVCRHQIGDDGMDSGADSDWAIS